MKVVINLKKHRQWGWVQKNYINLLGIIALALSVLIGGMVIVHFQFGLDIPLLHIAHHETAQYWGQIGDFIGGILNPVLSFCALIAVLYNLSLQREELALARKDARDAQEIQNRQSAIFKQQNFESVFFRLLEAHSSLSKGMSIKIEFQDGSKLYEGEEAFSYLANRYLLRSSSFLKVNPYVDFARQNEVVLDRAQGLLNDHVGSVGHYFRNMYQILKYVDGFGHASSGSSSKAPKAMEIRRAIRNYRSQRDYANMLRAQLSSSEVACLFLNCLALQGAGLKYYVEKYSMLKTLELKVIGSNPDVANLYNRLAYADYEDMEMADIVSHIQSRYQAEDEERSAPENSIA